MVGSPAGRTLLRSRTPVPTTRTPQTALRWYFPWPVPISKKLAVCPVPSARQLQSSPSQGLPLPGPQWPLGKQAVLAGFLTLNPKDVIQMQNLAAQEKLRGVPHSAGHGHPWDGRLVAPASSYCRNAAWENHPNWTEMLAGKFHPRGSTVLLLPVCLLTRNCGPGSEPFLKSHFGLPQTDLIRGPRGHPQCGLDVESARTCPPEPSECASDVAVDCPGSTKARHAQ